MRKTRRHASFGPISESSSDDECGLAGVRSTVLLGDDSSETLLLSHHYQICDVIEKGPICTIYRAMHKRSSKSYTVKSLDLKRYKAVSGLSQEEVEKEVEICASLKHPQFCRLHDAIYGERTLHMIFEHVEGEDICFEIVRRAAAGFIYSEAVASHYIKQLLEALQTLHEQGIVHRDIRPHNLMLANKENNAPLKLRGFGVARMLHGSRCLPGRVGIPQFMSPEMVAGREYGTASDVWSAGCVVYLLLSGKLPFVGVGNAVFDLIQAGEYSFSDPLWARIGEQAKDFLAKMLETKEERRWSATKCLQHPWIIGRQEASRMHLAETVENIRYYNTMRKLKSNIIAAIGNVRLGRDPFHSVAIKVGGDSCDFDSTLGQCSFSGKYHAPQGAETNPEASLESTGIYKILTSLDQITLLTEDISLTEKSSMLYQQIEATLNDSDLETLLLLYDKIRCEGIRPAPINKEAEKLLNQVTSEARSTENPSVELQELLQLLRNPHLTAILQAQDVIIDEVFTSAPLALPEVGQLIMEGECSEITNLSIKDVQTNTISRRGDDYPYGAIANGTLINPQSAAEIERRGTSRKDDDASQIPHQGGAHSLPGRAKSELLREDKSPFFDADNDDLLLNAVSRVRLVQFQKNSDEPMGITLRVAEDKRCFIARIMHGGLVHRQSTLHVGDEICEINGIDVRSQSIDGLQRLLRDVRGRVQFKIVPSYRSAPPPCEIFVRAQFDYNPAEDDLIPCAQAGIPFKTGDILQVISKEDHNWWQARFVRAFPALGHSPANRSSPNRACSGCAIAASTSALTSSAGAAVPPLATNHVPPKSKFAPYSSLQPSSTTPFAADCPVTSAALTPAAQQEQRVGENAVAGLIPSPELQEWRTACLAIEQQKADSFHCTWLSRKKKYYTTRYLRKHSELFDKLDLVTYEEVVRLSSFRRKTLVLLGAHGVGRRMIKNYLIHRHPHRFSYPIPHTTRPPRKDEIDGKQYYFVSNDAMLADIQAGEYLEYGSFEECMYGTKLETIRQIHRAGKMAILDVEPQALKVLRTAEYTPFVVFITAPDLKGLEDPDGSLKNLAKESEALKTAFGHLMDYIIINTDIDETIKQLELVVEKLAVYAQWVPQTWIF